MEYAERERMRIASVSDIAVAFGGPAGADAAA
jgi:hypothetical protein